MKGHEIKWPSLALLGIVIGLVIAGIGGYYGIKIAFAGGLILAGLCSVYPGTEDGDVPKGS